MTLPISSDWRYKGEHFQQRAFLLSVLVRLGIPLSRDVYEFCDLTISQGWKTPTDERETNFQVKTMFDKYLNEVKNGW